MGRDGAAEQVTPLSSPPSPPAAAATSSLLQLKNQLNISRSEAIRRAVAAIEHAATLCTDIEFSAEDAGRSDRAFLADIIGAVIAAGAKTINVPDTVRRQ